MKTRKLTTILALSAAIVLTGCNEQEFYEKQYLEGVGVKKEIPNDEVEIGNTETPETQTPIVVVPEAPQVETPVVVVPTKPEVIPPEVIAPTTPKPETPVVVVPTTPEVETPVITTPSVPVVEAPIELPPIIVQKQEILDNFIQNSKSESKVDILWVVDDSGSMQDEQESLATNFNTFIENFLTREIDFKMAIITTDGTTSRNGRKICDFEKLDSIAAKNNQNSFISDYKKCIKVGTTGSPKEQGLKTSLAFLDRNKQTNFLREDAYLVVVYISDEEDQSQGLVKDYVSAIQGFKKNPGHLKTYSIINQKAQWFRSRSLGLRYKEASDLTGGTSADIKSNFHGVLKDMGGSILNLLESFALSQPPISNTIKVYVNHIQVTEGWKYDSTSKTLKFEKASVPTQGAKISIKYETLTKTQKLAYSGV